MNFKIFWSDLMDKLLKFEWFKAQKFPTKEDGIAFIKSIPKLQEYMDKKSDEIEEFKYEQIDDFEEFFGKFESKKQIYLVELKKKRAEKMSQKKDLQKQALKEELRQEILRELDEEKMKETNMHIEVFSLETLKNLFVKLAKKNLKKKEMNEIEKLQKEAASAIETLKRVQEQLETY
jgi:hypothetical protein